MAIARVDMLAVFAPRELELKSNKGSPSTL